MVVLRRWRTRWRRDGHEAGQSTFELIGYVIVVVFVTVIAIQAVYVSQAAATAQQAARDGARAYTLGQPVSSAVDAQLPGWVEAKGAPSVTFPTTDSVKVEVTIDVPVMAGQRRVGTVTVTRSAEMPTVRKTVTVGLTVGGAPHRAGISGLLDPSTLCRLSWAPSKLLRCDAAAALEQVNQAYRACAGTNLSITDAYRDLASQFILWDGGKNPLAAVPGTSNHGWGVAVDLGGGIGVFGSPQYQCMQQAVGDTGWAYPAWAEPTGSLPEPWHWEYTR